MSRRERGGTIGGLEDLSVAEREKLKVTPEEILKAIAARRLRERAARAELFNERGAEKFIPALEKIDEGDESKDEPETSPTVVVADTVVAVPPIEL